MKLSNTVKNVREMPPGRVERISQRSDSSFLTSGKPSGQLSSTALMSSPIDFLSSTGSP